MKLISRYLITFFRDSTRRNIILISIITFERRLVKLAGCIDGFAFRNCRRLRECLEHRALGFFVWNCNTKTNPHYHFPLSSLHNTKDFGLTENVEGTRREATARVVERLARVGAAILGEDLGNYEFVYVSFAAVLEVLARFYFFVVVQPDDVEFVRPDYSTAQGHRAAVVHHLADQVIYYLGRVVLRSNRFTS